MIGKFGLVQEVASSNLAGPTKTSQSDAGFLRPRRKSNIDDFVDAEFPAIDQHKRRGGPLEFGVQEVVNSNLGG